MSSKVCFYFVSIYFSYVTTSRCAGYKNKLQLGKTYLPDPMTDLKTGWMSEEEGRHEWPPTMYADIVNYLLDRNERTLEHRLLGDYKAGKASSYFASGKG